MKMALSPTKQAEYRNEPAYRLNFSLRACKVCRIRRSVGQYSQNQEVCDRCVNRIPKPK
jgi:hypothetical protein